MNSSFQNNAEAIKAYADYERRTNIRHLDIGCYLVITLMPAGAILDYFVYPEKAAYFFKLRLFCAAFGALVWGVLRTPLREKFDRMLCLAVAMLPAFFIALMIYDTEGIESPYYAGLTLVLLCVSFIVRWSADLSIATAVCVLAMYYGACFLHGTAKPPVPIGIVVNNSYFLVITAFIVVASGWIHRTLRMREFVLNYELDASKRDLETSNAKLAEQNTALEKANREIKEAEMQLVQAEKMSSLGRFSAGLMHDVLNPLNYARTSTYTLRKKCRNIPPEFQAEFDAILTDVEDGLKRVDNIVSDLRSFTHPGGAQAENTDLEDVFKTSLRFVSGELKEHGVEIQLNLQPGQHVWISRNQFSLILVNILENAIDALCEKSFSGAEKPSISITSREEDERGIITIRDNGPGISPENLAKVFDPFFTTKDVGKGTGLGLSICFGIVRGYGGKISASSEVGTYCEFIIDLPSTAEAAERAKNSNADQT